MSRERPRVFGVLGRRLLLAFLTVTVFPLLITNVVGYWRSRAVMEELVTENIAKTARVYAAEVDEFLEDHRTLLKTFAGSRDIEQAASAAVEGSPHLEAVYVLNNAGELVMSHPPSGEAWSVPACRELLQAPESKMRHAGSANGHEVVVAVPYPPTDGVLCGRVDFTLHQDMLTERARSVVGGVAYIVDRSGEVVCHSFEDDEPHAHPGHQVPGRAHEVATAGKPWSGTFAGPDGPHVGAFATARGLPWGVWVEVPKEVAVASMKPFLQQTLLGSLVFVALLVLGVLVLVRRLVEPLQQLVEATGTIAEGTYGQTIPVRGDDEVAQLSTEFNRMSEALAESYAKLDERVATRTRELQAARDFSDLLLNTMEQRILVIDRDLNILRANDAAQRAYGPEVVGCSCKEVHGGVTGCPAKQVLENSAPHFEERSVEREGRTEILAVEMYPVPDASGGAAAVIEIARDVTQLKQMQAQLMHQEKMAAVGTLAAGLAHEIGNPLASMSSELEMMEADWDPDAARESMPVLRDQVRRMSGLLRELVDFSRPPSEQAEVLDPSILIDDVMRLIRHDPRCRGVELVRDVAADFGTVCSNRDRLVQVLLNLGLNALDAMKGEGTLSFLATGDGREVRIEVRDTGPGVPEELADRVFEPFFTTKPPGKGTGLGLFVSERVVNQLGGRIEMVGTPGASFTIVLPDCACLPEPPEVSDG